MDYAGLAGEPRICSKDFVTIAIVNALAYIGNFMLMSTLPLIVLKLSGSSFMAGSITGVYALAGFLVRPRVGAMLDRGDRRRILLAGLLVMLLATGLYNLTLASLVLMFACRIVHGAGWSAITTSTSTIASSLVPPSRRAEGMGHFSISMSIAMVVGPPLGLFVMGRDNYHGLFIASSACLIAASAISLLSFRPSDEPPRREKGGPMKAPAFERTAVPASLLFFAICVTYGGITIFVPSYAQDRGLAGAGAFFVVIASAMLLTRLFTGRIADRAGPRPVIAGGMVFMIAALALLCSARTLGAFLASAALYGLGYGAAQPVLNATAIAAAPAGRRGAANSTFLSAMDVAGIASSLVWGFAAQACGFASVYLFSALILALALPVFLAVARRRGE